MPEPELTSQPDPDVAGHQCDDVDPVDLLPVISANGLAEIGDRLLSISITFCRACGKRCLCYTLRPRTRLTAAQRRTLLTFCQSVG